MAPIGDRFSRAGQRDPHPDEDPQLRGGHIPSRVFSNRTTLGVAKVEAFWNLNLTGEHNHGLVQESYTYSLIQDSAIAPKFLAHLTECHGRVIGYVLEAISVRPARLRDLGAYREVLQRLHSLGIAHGSLTRMLF
jgi:hypothetical protein